MRLFRLPGQHLVDLGFELFGRDILEFVGQRLVPFAFVEICKHESFDRRSTHLDRVPELPALGFAELSCSISRLISSMLIADVS